MKIRVANARSRFPAWVLLRLLIVLGLYAPIVVGVVALSMYTFFARGLPEIPEFAAYSQKEISTIRASHHGPIAERYNEKRYIVGYDRIPRALVDAVLATEDASFFDHSGIDLKGIARAALHNLMAGRVVAGGSTITQQVAKSFIGAERSLWRKVKEAILARRMETVYSKEEILLLYLNRIYLGHHSYGVQAAALNYFRKNVEELSLMEASLLAGTIQSPSYRNPYADAEGARLRAEHVLRRMRNTGRIDQAAMDAALAQEVVVYPVLDTYARGAPYFARWVQERLDSNHPGWRKRGINAWTTADLWLTRRGERALWRGAEALGRRQGYRGPLTRLDSAARVQAFDAAVARYLAESGGLDALFVPARVTAVSKDRLDFQVTPARTGRLTRAELAWARPYTEFPRRVVIVREVEDQLRFEELRDDGEVRAISRKAARRWFSKARLRAAERSIRAGERDQVRLERYEPTEPVSWSYWNEKKNRYKPGLKDTRKAFTEHDVILVRHLDDAEGAARWELVDRPGPEGALAMIDPATGDVPVAIGGLDFDRSQVNRLFSVRQTGSLIKPVFYALAYSLGLAPSQVFSGTPYREGDYNPAGARGREDMTVWRGLAKSRNNISLRIMRFVLDRVPLDAMQAWGAALGLTRPFDGYLAEVLGANQTLDDMLNPFCTFLRHGDACERRPILLLTDKDGQVLEDHRVFHHAFNRGQDVLMGFLNLTRDPPVRRVPPEVAAIMVENLRRVVQVGTATRARDALKTPAGGKTGTLAYDLWFVGFLDDLVAGVWLGSDRNERYVGRARKGRDITASAAALPVWIEAVQGWLAHRARATRVVQLLDDLEWPDVDPDSGLLSADGVSMPHLKNTSPTVRAEEIPLQRFEEVLWDL
jgi:penicillin-binding protein 1A